MKDKKRKEMGRERVLIIGIGDPEDGGLGVGGDEQRVRVRLDAEVPPEHIPLLVAVLDEEPIKT